MQPSGCQEVCWYRYTKKVVKWKSWNCPCQVGKFCCFLQENLFRSSAWKKLGQLALKFWGKLGRFKCVSKPCLESENKTIFFGLPLRTRELHLQFLFGTETFPILLKALVFACPRVFVARAQRIYNVQIILQVFHPNAWNLNVHHWPSLPPVTDTLSTRRSVLRRDSSSIRMFSTESLRST